MRIASTGDVTARIRDAASTRTLRPESSSDEFLAKVQRMPQRNLAVEMLRKLLSGEIRSGSRRNVVQARSFAELLENAIRK